MVGRLEINVTAGRPGDAPQRRSAGQAMRLLLLGDFSGRPAHDRPALATRPTHRVDVDGLGAVMQQIGRAHV